jgi:hypothetical protein
MVDPAMSDADAAARLGGFDVTEVPSGKRYLRTTVSWS